MKNHVELMMRVFELSQTLGEGLQHMEIQLAELRFEEAFNMLQDIVEATCAIGNSLKLLTPEGQENQLVIGLYKLNHWFEQMIFAYQNQQLNNMQTIVQMHLRPLYSQWQQQLELYYRDNVLS